MFSTRPGYTLRVYFGALRELFQNFLIVSSFFEFLIVRMFLLT